MYTEQKLTHWFKAINRKLRNGIWSKEGINNLRSGEKVTCVSSMLYYPYALAIHRAIPGYISRTIERGQGGFQWRVSPVQRQTFLTTLMQPGNPPAGDAPPGNLPNQGAAGADGGDGGGGDQVGDAATGDAATGNNNDNGGSGDTGLVTPLQRSLFH